MCGRYTLHTDLQTIEAHFHIQTNQGQLSPRYNIAPSQAVLGVRMGSTGRELTLLHWGLVPFWAKDTKIGYRTINARAETVASKPAFRAAFRRRRCLLAADGFYEWQAQSGGKQPFYITLRDRGLFAFAGLWEQWRGANDEALESCTLIVTEANALMRPIHHRMPVILDPSDYATWLDPATDTKRELEALLKPYPSESMVAYPVSREVNNPKHTDASCITPL